MEKHAGKIRQIAISSIRVAERIRKENGSLDELAQDIQKHGLLNPITVMEQSDGGYVLIAGLRRMKAMAQMNAVEIRATVMSPMEADEMLMLEIAENEQRKLAIELFSTMDIKNDEENLCGQIAALLSDWKKKNDGILAYYDGSVQYPGKRVADDGKRIVEHILLYGSDHTAFLNAFTEAEDDLLDWSEDFREVSFFFANQKTIFDNASDGYCVCFRCTPFHRTICLICA